MALQFIYILWKLKSQSEMDEKEMFHFIYFYLQKIMLFLE